MDRNKGKNSQFFGEKTIKASPPIYIYRVSHPSYHPPKKTESQKWGEEEKKESKNSPYTWDSDFFGGDKKDDSPCIYIYFETQVLCTYTAYQTGTKKNSTDGVLK